KGLNYGTQYIETAIKKGVETIVNYGVITIDTTIFREQYCKEYLNYERLFNNLNKETLCPNKNKKNSYSTQYSLKPLIKKLAQNLYNDCFNIHFAVVDALIQNGVKSVSSYIDEDSKQKSTALFNNYKDGFINKTDECKVVKQIITLNPYRQDIYEYLIKEDGDFSQDIEKLTDYLGYDIKDYKDKLMDLYINEIMQDNKGDLDFAKERVVKYSKYIGCNDETIYVTRIDAIYTFETA
ncbi:MAG: kinase, partial [Peptostreptococcaceae bacterium]